MDTLTHALSGALIARAAAPRVPVPGDASISARMAVATVAAAFPDIDWVLSIISPVYYLTLHRGVTHSFVLLPLWSLAIAWLWAALARDPGGWKPYFVPASLGIAAHIVGDWITSFGTMLLAPLSDRRFALSTTFIIDPYFTAIIVGGLLATLLSRRSARPARAARIALCVLAAYVAGQSVALNRALDTGRALAAINGWADATVTAWPGPLSPLNWMIVADLGNRYHVAYVNLLRAEPVAASPEDGLLRRLDATYRPLSAIEWTTYSLFGDDGRAIDLARRAWTDPGFQFYRWFAELPALYRIEAEPSMPVDLASHSGHTVGVEDASAPVTRGCAWFFDLRFALPGRANPPFRYGQCTDYGGRFATFLLEGADQRIRVR